jgi:hypothetical protein
MTRNLLLSGGPVHDFDATSEALAGLLEDHDVHTTVVHDPGAAAALLRGMVHGGEEPYDLLTVNALRWRMEAPRHADLRAEHAYRLTDADAAAFEEFVRGGGGLLALHAAVICFDAHPAWRELCGASWDWAASSHPACGPTLVTLTAAGRDHPLTAGLDDFVIDDEVYGFLDEAEGLVPLLTGEHGGRHHPLLWARATGAGRVVTDLLGHGVASIEHPDHRTILVRAAAWAARDRALPRPRGGVRQP